MRVAMWRFSLSQQLRVASFPQLSRLFHQLRLSWRECLPCTDSSFIFYHGLRLPKSVEGKRGKGAERGGREGCQAAGAEEKSGNERFEEGGKSEGGT